MQNARNIIWLCLLVVCLSACIQAASTPETSVPVPQPSTPSGLPPTATNPPLLNPTATTSLFATISAAPTGIVSGPLREFRMVDPNVGWGAGDNQVVRSADSGANWLNVTPKEIQLEGDQVPQVFAIDAASAWLLALDPADRNGGLLFRTGDGGQTWQSGHVPFGGGYAQVVDPRQAFFMADRGVAAGSHAVDIYHTLDGGASWTLVAKAGPDQSPENGLPFSGNKSGITFRDAIHGWVTGFIPMDGSTYMYRTLDAGKTWMQIQLMLPLGLEKSQVEVEPPRFFDGKDGVLLARVMGEPPAQVFYLTRDGGDSWNAAPPISMIGLVSIVSMTEWVVWDGGSLQASQDAGQTWQTVSPNINLDQKITGLQFLTPKNGWALSMDGDKTQLFRTEDGGKTWK